jgi:hypothetical protein
LVVKRTRRRSPPGSCPLLTSSAPPTPGRLPRVLDRESSGGVGRPRRGVLPYRGVCFYA